MQGAVYGTPVGNLHEPFFLFPAQTPWEFDLPFDVVDFLIPAFTSLAVTGIVFYRKIN